MSLEAAGPGQAPRPLPGQALRRKFARGPGRGRRVGPAGRGRPYVLLRERLEGRLEGILNGRTAAPFWDCQPW